MTVKCPNCNGSKFKFLSNLMGFIHTESNAITIVVALKCIRCKKKHTLKSEFTSKENTINDTTKSKPDNSSRSKPTDKETPINGTINSNP